jgi:hypothetical protein
MNVQAFKLVNGQEIVAVLEKTQYNNVTMANPSGYTLRKPHILQLQQDGRGHIGMVFIPWTLANPDLPEIFLPAEHVMFSFSPAEEVERQYLSQTSGIDLSGTV